MTDTTTLEAAATPRRSGSLSALKLAELQGLASSMGISGTAKMRKNDLVEAIKARQGGAGAAPAPERQSRTPRRGQSEQATPRSEGAAGAPVDGPQAQTQTEPARDRAAQDGQQRAGQDGRERAGQDRVSQNGQDRQDEVSPQDRAGGDRNAQDRQQRRGRGEQNRGEQGRGEPGRGEQGRGEQGRGEQGREDQQNRQQGQQPQQRNQPQQGNEQNGQGSQGGQQEFDEEGTGGRRRRNRNRNRDKRRGRSGDYSDLEASDVLVSEDDVLLPVAGILDVLDNYAFVRTSGYLPGPGDVYVPLGMVKKSGLRKGDAVTGAVRAPRENEQPQQQGNRQKFNPLVRLDSVNGMSVDDARKRPDFGKLIPLYPQDRLRMETDPANLTTRIIDLIAPVGKGQRGLIVAPAKAGKTMIMQSIANAITANNPEVHLMVVLVDERPEEVTDMQRAVKGEVIASTFDRPAEDHTTVAELSIERAKRLVEMGHDVVVLLDSITKLGRAYNLAAPASGRILSGGVDSAALYPPKKFFGAARNIEHGGSLTILATALVETGSRMDEVIFEEFKGTGNMELRLSRELANRRIFPAVDVNNSSTRREEILLAPEELKIMWKLRRVLAALDSQQGIELLLDRLRKAKTNYEFLVQVQQTSNIRLDDDDEK